MKDRTCFLCGKPLHFEDYIEVNSYREEFITYRKITEKNKICKLEWNEIFKEWDLVKVWEAKEIELMCCYHQEFLNELVKQGRPLWDLLAHYNDPRIDKLTQLGILNHKQLQELKKKK